MQNSNSQLRKIGKLEKIEISSNFVNNNFAKVAMLLSILLVLLSLYATASNAQAVSSDFLLSTSNPRANIKVRFEESVTITAATLTRLSDNTNISLALISSQDNKLFTYRPIIDLTEADYKVKIYALDFLNNSGITEKNYNVNFSFVVQLVTPRYGKSQTLDFPITFSTSQNATCKYDFIAPKPWESYKTFDSQTETLHRINNFSLSTPGFSGMIFVICNTSYGQMYGSDRRFGFLLSQDNTAPSFVSLTAVPNPISECLLLGNGNCELKTKLIATTNEPVLCKYDIFNVSYQDMFSANVFSSSNIFSLTNTVNLTLPREGAYNYYVICQDMTSPPMYTPPTLITIIANTSIPLQITSTGPSGYFSANNVLLTAATNKAANCTFTQQNGTIVGFSFMKIDHSATFSNLRNGTQNFAVSCTNMAETAQGSISFVTDRTYPAFLYINDSAQIGDPQKTPSRNKLWVRFKAEDNESGIREYKYRVEKLDGSTYSSITTWFNLQSSDAGNLITVTDLELTNGTYRFMVNATNRADLSKLEASDGIRVDTSYQPYIPPSCSDGIKNQNELDIDCGGSCQKCSNGKMCAVSSDCTSGYCNATNKICIAPPCTNGIKDAWNLETDTDCGGNCISSNKTCVLGKSCIANSDCTTGYCNPSKVCSIPTCSDGYKNGNESGKDCGGSCSAKCDNTDSCRQNSDCKSNFCIGNVCKNDPDDIDADGKKNDKDDDIDGDGKKNWQDPDDDNDKICDTGVSQLNNATECTGNDDDDNGNGKRDKEDIDKDNDLDNDGTDNNHDDDIDGDGIKNDLDPDDDNDGQCDIAASPLNDAKVCASEDKDDDNDGVLDTEEDTDGDGMPDWWEIQNGTNPFVADSEKIDEVSGKTFKEVYKKYVESTKTPLGTDTTMDETSSGFSWIFLLIMVILFGIFGAGGYLFYTNKQKEKESRKLALQKQMTSRLGNTLSQQTKPPLGGSQLSSQQKTPLGSSNSQLKPAPKPVEKPLISRSELPNQKQMTPQMRQLIQKKREEKFKSRTNIFGLFGQRQQEQQQGSSQFASQQQNTSPAKATTQTTSQIKSSPVELKKQKLELIKTQDGELNEEPKKQKKSQTLDENYPKDDWIDVKKLKKDEKTQVKSEKSKNIFDQIAEFAGIGKTSSDSSQKEDQSKITPEETSSVSKKSKSQVKETEHEDDSSDDEAEDKIFGELSKIAKKKKK